MKYGSQRGFGMEEVLYINYKTKEMTYIIIKHSVHSEISDQECVKAIPSNYKDDNPIIIEIKPAAIPLGDTIDDWDQLEIIQRKLYLEKVKPIINENPGATIFYFGFAPIPLIIHLGSLIDNWQKVYPMFRTHDTKEWRYELDQKKQVVYKIEGLPNDENLSNKDISLNIGLSFKVNADVTSPVVGDSLMKVVNLEVVNPGYENLYDQNDLIDFGKRMDEVFSVLNLKFPNMSVVHIFASIPIPVAFVLGHKVQPNIYPVLYTYQFKSSAETQFQLAIIINQSVEEKVEFTVEQYELAAKYRGSWNEMLTQKLNRFIKNLNDKPKGNWFDYLSTDVDWSSFNVPYWRYLEPLVANELLVQDKINQKNITVANGFDYDQTVYEWSIDTSVFVALLKRLKEEVLVNKAGRLFLLHESLHYSFHNINKQVADGIGSFPKVIEESDYHADVYALFHDYAWSKLYDDKFDEQAYKSWFIETIHIMIETMWSFDDTGEDLKEIQIRRMNRFLIWYWQSIRIKYANSIKQVVDILSEKPIIEFSGLLIKASSQRIFYNLEKMAGSIGEMAVYANGKVIRTTPPNYVKLIEGFKKLDGKMINDALEMLYKVVYK